MIIVILIFMAGLFKQKLKPRDCSRQSWLVKDQIHCINPVKSISKVSQKQWKIYSDEYLEGGV